MQLLNLKINTNSFVHLKDVFIFAADNQLVIFII